jgi:phage tail-like protein
MELAVRNDPYVGFNFLVEIDGLQVGGFSKVSGLSVKIETIPYHEGGAGSAVCQLAGAPGYGDVTLSRGMTESAVLWNWMMQTAEGNFAPRQVSIILRRPDPSAKQTRWNLRNAWPSEWQGASLDASSRNVSIESLILVFGGIELK